MAAPAKGVAPEAYAYYYVYGHSVAFAGSIGSVVYYKNVNPSTWACGTSLWRAYWYGREITGRYCSGSHVWKIKLRMVVADV